jgi:hypothetical protein
MYSAVRSHEVYAKNYSIVYPHDEPLALRKQPDEFLTGDESDPDGSQRKGHLRCSRMTGTALTAKASTWNKLTSIDSDVEDDTFDFPRNHGIVSQSANRSEFFVKCFLGQMII